VVVRLWVQPARRPRTTTGSNDWQPGAYRKALHETEGAWRQDGHDGHDGQDGHDQDRRGVKRQASSVKRQASGGGRRVERVGAAGKRRGRGLGAIMYHVATYLLCIPCALSRLTGGPWYVMGASECRPMCKNAAAARRQP
jgi:hypothetical protein